MSIGYKVHVFTISCLFVVVVFVVVCVCVCFLLLLIVCLFFVKVNIGADEVISSSPERCASYLVRRRHEYCY